MVSRSEELKLFKSLKRLFKAILDRVAKGAGADEIRQTGREYLASPESDKHIRNMISRMVRNVRVSSARSWREAAARSGNGRMIHEAIKNEMKGTVGNRVWELIAENAAYIKTVPQEWAKYISDYAARETLKGRRPEDVEKELRRVMPQHMTKNLKCIARTECAKANAAIVQARAEMCGIRAYFWRCVADERSRDSHIGMDGVLVFYNDPPNPEKLFPVKGQKPYGNYHAGNTFNCRCYQEPVVDERFLPDVMNVHDHGRIVRMTKHEVLRNFGNVA